MSYLRYDINFVFNILTLQERMHPRKEGFQILFSFSEWNQDGCAADYISIAEF